MPKELERKLKQEAKSKGLGKERTNAYIYGSLRKMGWTPNSEGNAHTKRVAMKHYEKK